jgi:hypothetical protein
MEVLLARIEAEGRTQTAALLRDGLKVIDRARRGGRRHCHDARRAP